MLLTAAWKYLQASRVLNAPQDCVAAIAAHAFTSTPFPAIITLENHTDEANQVRYNRVRYRAGAAPRLYHIAPVGGEGTSGWGLSSTLATVRAAGNKS
jgi:hypothetical protein